MHSKRNHKQNKRTHRMRETICNRCNWQGTNLQNIQTAHTAQHQKTNNPIKTMGERSKYTFLQRRHTDGQKPMKRCSTSLTILSVLETWKSKLQMWYYLTLITIGIIKKSTNNAGEDIEKREASCALAGNVHWYSHYGGQYRGSLKIWK